MTDNALSIRSLNVELGFFRLKDINLEVKKGTILGFVGKNGTGKTTLIKTVMDVILPKSGEILYDGLPLRGNEEAVKSRIGVVYDSLIYPAAMKAGRVAKMVAPFYSGFDMNRWRRLMARFYLNEHMKLAELSKGMQMKFSIAMALSYNPDLLILDEPTAGLDPSARAELLDLLLEYMQDENKAIFFSTHITSDLDKIADYIALIDNGEIQFSMEKDSLLDRYAVAHIDKEAMNDALYRSIVGLKETVFGYEGLCENRAALENTPGVKLARPTVEDILIYRGGLHAQVV